MQRPVVIICYDPTWSSSHTTTWFSAYHYSMIDPSIESYWKLEILKPFKYTNIISLIHISNTSCHKCDENMGEIGCHFTASL